MTYLSNVLAWVRGFRRLKSDVSYKEGWGPRKFFWLYLFDYGFCVVVLAGAVESVTRYVHDHWFNLGYHGAHSGPPLWGTVRCTPLIRLLVPVAWLVIAIFILK